MAKMQFLVLDPCKYAAYPTINKTHSLVIERLQKGTGLHSLGDMSKYYQNLNMNLVLDTSYSC